VTSSWQPFESLCDAPCFGRSEVPLRCSYRTRDAVDRQQLALSDVAVVRPEDASPLLTAPDGSRIAISVFVAKSRRCDAQCAAVIARAAELVVVSHRKQK